MPIGRGPGGQAINKTNSSVNLTHIPTGIVVQAQPTRSREENRRIARKILAERLELLRAKEAREKEADMIAEGRDEPSDGQRADGKKTRKEENRYLAGMYSKQELRDEKERRRKANKAKKQKKKAKDMEKVRDGAAAEAEEDEEGDGEEDIIEEPAKL